MTEREYTVALFIQADDEAHQSAIVGCPGVECTALHLLMRLWTAQAYLNSILLLAACKESER
jgi:hypothetical protein